MANKANACEGAEQNRRTWMAYLAGYLGLSVGSTHLAREENDDWPTGDNEAEATAFAVGRADGRTGGEPRLKPALLDRVHVILTGEDR